MHDFIRPRFTKKEQKHIHCSNYHIVDIQQQPLNKQREGRKREKSDAAADFDDYTHTQTHTASQPSLGNMWIDKALTL